MFAKQRQLFLYVCLFKNNSTFNKCLIFFLPFLSSGLFGGNNDFSHLYDTSACKFDFSFCNHVDGVMTL